MPDVTAGQFGTLLRHFRSDAGLTQEMLAERAGYSTVYISMLERGRRDPTPETVRVLARALGLGAVQQSALAAALGGGAGREPALVGRARERDILERHLAGEGPPVLLLAGEPGIGKSTLLRWIAARAGICGFALIEGGARRGPGESHAPIAEALRRAIAAVSAEELPARLAGCAWLARLLPELATAPVEPLPDWSVPPEVERRLLSEAVIRFLGNSQSPMLILDDLHWAGRDALDLLTVITRAATGIPLRIVAAYRDTDVDRRHPLATWIADLAQAGMIAQQPLGPLDADAAATLLARAGPSGGDLSNEIREHLIRRAGGVPFFLLSCAQALHNSAGAAEDIPWTVAQSVRQRLAALPEGADAVLAALAVTAPTTAEVLGEVAGADSDRTIKILEAATRGRLVEETGLDYAFSHDLIREVVEADSIAARRARLHRRAAEVLERGPRPLPVERIARHLVRCGMRERAVPYLAQAGEEARRRYALSASAGYFRELLDILTALGREAEAASAGEQLAEALTIAARYEDALTVLAEVERRYRELDDREGVWRTVAQIGRVHASRGSAEEGIQRLRPLIPPGNPDASGGLARLLTSLARLHFIRGEYAEQLAAAEEATRHARGIGDDRLLVDARNVGSVALGMLGRIPESLRAYDEVIRLGERTGLLEAVRAALGNAAATYLEAGQFAQGRPYLDRALAVAERIGDPTQIAFLRAMQGERAFYTGDWAAAREDLEAALGLVERARQNAVAGQTLVNLARLLLATGDTAAAIIYLNETLSSEEIRTLREARALLAERDLASGQPDRAIGQLLPLLDRAGAEEWDVTPLLALLAEARLMLGQLEESRELAASAVRRARSQGFGLALVDALRVLALVQAAGGDHDAAVASLDEALILARGMPYPLGEARLLATRSEIEESFGSAAAAGQARAAALVILERLGASPDAIGLPAHSDLSRIR